MSDHSIPGWVRTGGLFLAAITVALFMIIQPFWKPIFWPVVFTIMFWPLRTRWAGTMKGGATAATIAILLVILFFILIPMIVIIGLIADGAASVVVTIQEGEFQPMSLLQALPERFPALADRLATLGVEMAALQDYLQSALVTLGEFALEQLVNIGQGASVFGFQLFIFLYLAFAFLRAGDRIYAAVFNAIPMQRAHKEVFFKSFANMSAATIKGTVVVGIIQGALGAAAFWFLDIPGPVFWGAMMALLSVIPPFGAGFVWAPTAIYLAFSGSPVAGVGLFLWGAIVISMSDNLIRPIVVGRATSMPDYMVLLSTLGGLASFGLTGLVLGPVVAALFLAGWQVHTRDNPENTEETAA